MSDASENRIVPNNAMRRRYDSLSAQDMNVATRTVACDELLADVSPLVDDFVSAVRAWRSSSYDLRGEPFYPPGSRGVSTQSSGTIMVIDKLKKHVPISVASASPCSFAFVDREISPARTPGGTFSDGGKATSTGRGGIDYVARTLAPTPIPILGEIKVKGDKDAFYAFVQLLTYLSELCSDAQAARARRHLFQDTVDCSASWDLHILLADFNDRSAREPLLDRTRQLASKFKAALASRSERSPVGRIRCLRMATSTFNGSLDETWVV